jgi:O-acetylhomoserine/O-acetylserine sulfhydrylase-like pyridoxal-dependent enzyme
LPYAAAGQEVGYDGVRYTRCNNNPSQEVVGAKLAALEGEQLLLCSIMHTTSVSLTF